MESKQTYRLAFSSCPNDTFIFKAIARQLIDLKGYTFDIIMEDVETLNQKAKNNSYEITKMSYAAFGRLMDHYALLRSGSALGERCGPLIISRPGRELADNKKPVIAVPGLGTTAFHLFQFYMDDVFKRIKPVIVPMCFDKILPAIIKKKADFGVIIHEGRFVYQSMGVELKADLGQWWEEQTKLPIPLGCIAIRRDIAPDIARDIETLIRQSINHAFAHPDMAYDYIQSHAQELDKTVIQQHIDLYVNDYSKQIGERGEKAVTAFFEKSCQSGLMQPSDKPLFAC
ncbi:MAG: 1,4-dihydroxy-6-naphthoate synthase [Pseudomonadota bacterium]